MSNLLGVYWSAMHRRALENNTELLAKFVPTLPKRNSSRKSQGMNE